MNTAAKTRAFWNSHPCDGQHAADALREYRHAKEPWLPALLMQIAASENDILEVGCGQGADGLFLCRHMAKGGRYIGIDQSDSSVANAQRFAAEAAPLVSVSPYYKLGDALALPFESNSIGAAYSMGVLHHLNETERAIGEVFRVLRPGGKFYLGLYNSWAPKVAAAHSLRFFQHVLDTLSGRDRLIYRLLLNSPYGGKTGTMLHECFGVPVLKSYSAAGMRALLNEFNIEELSSFGSGSPPRVSSESRLPHGSSGSFGYLWVAIARKPTNGPH